MKIKIFSIICSVVLIFSINGCSNNTNSTEELINKTNFQETSTIPEAISETTSETSVDYINNFISKYNETTKAKISNLTSFEPTDKNDEHYKTEFRLGAFDGSIGMSGKIKNSDIDIINYGSHGGYFSNDKLRIYVTSNSLDELFSIFKNASKTMDDSITTKDLQDVIDYVNEMGDYNGFIIGKLEPGTILHKGKAYFLMLDVNYRY